MCGFFRPLVPIGHVCPDRPPGLRNCRRGEFFGKAAPHHPVHIRLLPQRQPQIIGMARIGRKSESGAIDNAENVKQSDLMGL